MPSMCLRTRHACFAVEGSSADHADRLRRQCAQVLAGGAGAGAQRQGVQGCGSEQGQRGRVGIAAEFAAVACMKSGMVTITASMFFACSSSILRKSLYFGAFSYSLNLRAARFSSTSQSATIFSEAQPLRSLCAFPPAPMDAMLSFSFGDL